MITHEALSALLGSDVHVQGNELRASVKKERFTALMTELVQAQGLSLSLVFGTDDRKSTKTFGVHAVLALPETHEWLTISAELPEADPRYESLTKTVMAAHWYERFMMDQFGIVAEGHPDNRRLVHHENVPEATFPLRKDFAWDTKMDHAEMPYPMHHVEGEGIYEIPVGPIHAGIIEPGHFRFNVAGERIITLEGKLFFTHKGVEKLLEDKTPEEALPLIERVSGDASASHALAYCQAVETLAEASIPERAQYLRALYTELERMTMHIHDLANMGGMGTGYTLLAAQGFRIKERLMRLSDRVLGNRFWRGGIVLGGIKKDLTEEQLNDVLKTAKEAYEEMTEIVEFALHSSGLRERLETTGVLTKDVAIAYGGLGLPARASGVDYDVRRDHPYAIYNELPLEIPLKRHGDVLSRFKMRIMELHVTMDLIKAIMKQIPSGSVHSHMKITDGSALGAVESWRGQILTYVAIENGKITRCFPRDPSFCNWALFGEIGPGNIVPDFPLCNKSLNLSYSGTDL